MWKFHGLYSPVKLGLAAALACSAFTFLLGGGPVEMLLAFIAASISASCLVYAFLLKLAEVYCGISSFHEAGYICSIWIMALLLKLKPIDFTQMPSAAAAFIGALTAGFLASIIKHDHSRSPPLA